MDFNQSYRPKRNTSKVPSHVNNNYYFSKPAIIGFMSVDGERLYHSDLSQLKFLNSNTNRLTSLDLNHNIQAAVKRTTDNNGEKIDLLLKFIIDHKQLLMNYQSKLEFLSYRRTLISIMCSAFGVKESLIIGACLYKNSIYLLSIESPQQVLRRHSVSKEEEKYCAWGYKFEQYLLSDQPNIDPDISKPVIENEEFSLFYKTSLENLQLLYGAQIDGLLTTMLTNEVPRTTDFEYNLNYLKHNSYVELKTNRQIYNSKQEYNFKRHKLLRCWCQCYLANLEGLYVGFRNDHGTVERLQWFSTQDIVNYCKNEWNPQVAINYLHYFLTYIKDTFNLYKSHPEPVSLQFELHPNNKITVSKCTEDILPNWFIQNI